MKCVNIKLWDILGCFHYMLNAPRNWLQAELRKLPLVFQAYIIVSVTSHINFIVARYLINVVYLTACAFIML